MRLLLTFSVHSIIIEFETFSYLFQWLFHIYFSEKKRFGKITMLSDKVTRLYKFYNTYSKFFYISSEISDKVW